MATTVQFLFANEVCDGHSDTTLHTNCFPLNSLV